MDDRQRQRESTGPPRPAIARSTVRPGPGPGPPRAGPSRRPRPAGASRVDRPGGRQAPEPAEPRHRRSSEIPRAFAEHPQGLGAEQAVGLGLGQPGRRSPDLVEPRRLVRARTRRRRAGRRGPRRNRPGCSPGPGVAAVRRRPDRLAEDPGIPPGPGGEHRDRRQPRASRPARPEPSRHQARPEVRPARRRSPPASRLGRQRLARPKPTPPRIAPLRPSSELAARVAATRNAAGVSVITDRAWTASTGSKRDDRRRHQRASRREPPLPWPLARPGGPSRPRVPGAGRQLPRAAPAGQGRDQRGQQDRIERRPIRGRSAVERQPLPLGQRPRQRQIAVGVVEPPEPAEHQGQPDQGRPDDDGEQPSIAEASVPFDHSETAQPCAAGADSSRTRASSSYARNAATNARRAAGWSRSSRFEPTAFATIGASPTASPTAQAIRPAGLTPSRGPGHAPSVAAVVGRDRAGGRGEGRAQEVEGHLGPVEPAADDQEPGRAGAQHGPGQPGDPRPDRLELEPERERRVDRRRQRGQPEHHEHHAADRTARTRRWRPPGT